VITKILAYDFGTEANFCTFETVMKPVGDGLQDWCSTFTIDFWCEPS